MKRTFPTTLFVAVFTTALIALASSTQSLASTLTNGLVAYWPFDNAVGCDNATPDLVNGYNMQVIYGAGNSSGFFLTNFNNQIYLTNDAVRGNAIHVDNTDGNGNILGNAFALAFKSVNTNDLVPINRYSPGSNTVSFWIKTGSNHPAPNSDQRVFCESDYIRTYASVFDLSPVGLGYDIFLRQQGAPAPLGNFSGGNHSTVTGNAGTNAIADGTWHNVTIETIPTPGGTNAATYEVFVDAVLDPNSVGLANLVKPEGTWKLDTVAVFELVRNGAAGPITNCSVDDLAEWSRPLATNEIQDFMSNGIAGLTPAIAPLTIQVFASDLYSVNQGTAAALSWQVSQDATSISIDNGVGDVTALSSCGVGSTNVIINGTTTFTITVKRGASTVTKSLTVVAIQGVATNWFYIGGFNEIPLGGLANQGNWQTLSSSPQTFDYQDPQVEDTITGNHVLGIIGTTDLSGGFFGSHSVPVNSSNTLFFRFYLDPSVNVQNTNDETYPDVDVGVGATDRALRDAVDFVGTDKGPSVRIYRHADGDGGPIDLTADWGASNTTGFSYVSSVDPTGLAVGAVYNVWIDIHNSTNDPVADASSYYGVTIQKGDAGPVTTLFTNQISDRSTNSSGTMIETFIISNDGTEGQGTNNVLLDDFYISAGGGFLHTLPTPAGSFVLGTPASPTSITITSVKRTNNAVTLTWSTVPTNPGSGIYTFSVQSRASLTSGSWATVQDAITNKTYTVTGANAAAQFYRVTSP